MKSKLIEYKDMYIIQLPSEQHIICMGSDGKWDDNYNYNYYYCNHDDYNYNDYNYNYNYNYYYYYYNYYYNYHYKTDISIKEPSWHH